jgi:hypothetical protein
MQRGRALLAIVATGLAAVAVVQLARVDAGIGPAFGPDRTMGKLDAVSLAPTEQVAGAREVLEARPIDGRAYRAIALAQGRSGLLETANARWPRDVLARATLADRALAEGDAATGLAHLDALLRIAPGTRAEILPLLMPYLHDVRVRAALVERMAGDPPWHGDLLAALRRDTTDAADAERFLSELAQRVKPTHADLQARVELLDRAGRTPEARTLWLSTLAPDDRAAASLVFDGGFERPDVRDGFGWHIDDVPGATVGYDSLLPRSGAAALSIEFEDRAVRFAAVRQRLALAAGRYRMTVAARNEVDNERPFELRIDCRGRDPIARVALDAGRADWTTHETRFEVPADCTHQTLVLAHTARSLAERRLRGRLLIDDVGIFLAK